MNRDKATYGSIQARYDEWIEIVESKPAPVEKGLPTQRPYTPQREQDDMGKMVFAAIGFGIGVLLLLLSAWAFAVAAKWSGLDRMGAATGYTLIGAFLLISGAGGIISTWNHNFRVMARQSTHSH